MRFEWMLGMLGVLLASAGCDGTEGTETGRACAESNLIAQCPPGSDPILEASATSQCEGEGSFSDGVGSTSGRVEGVCRGEGTCVVFCQFAVPCDCGVDRITNDGVFCRSCMESAACGNQVCEGTETPESCPQDCGCVCEDGRQRCNGDKLQVCENCRWTELDCGANEACRRDAEQGAVCERTGI